MMRPGKVLMWSKVHLFVEVLSQTIPLFAIKIYTTMQISNYKSTTIDILFYFFAILNLIDFATEYYIEKHIMKRAKKTILLKRVFKKRKLSIFKQTTYTTLIGLAMTFLVVIIFVFASGKRVCPQGQFRINPISCGGC